MIFYPMDSDLFNTNDLGERLSDASMKSEWAVTQYDSGQLERFSDNEIVVQVLARHFPEPLVLQEEQAHYEPLEVGGYTTVTVTIPYIGDSNLWTYKHGRPRTPMARGFGFGKSDTKKGTISFTSYFKADEPDSSILERDIQKRLEAIHANVDAIRNVIELSRERAESSLRVKLVQRRKQAEMTKEKLSRITIPLKRNPSAPGLQKVPLKRKIVPPLPAAKPTTPEYAISDADFEYILKVIRHEGATFETARRTFAKLGEEDIRHIIRAHLNGHFEGDAHGEAFRDGKTDILIEYENRAAFVAECKNWEGKEVLHDTLDQLLGYTTWRDTKTALIFFNRDRKDFKAIQDKMEPHLAAYDGFRQRAAPQHPGEWRVVCRSKNDPDRLITVHVFLFDLYVQPKDGGAIRESAATEGDKA